MKNKEIYQDRKIKGVEIPKKDIEKKEKIFKKKLDEFSLLEEEILELEKKLSKKKREREKKTEEYLSKEKIENDEGAEEEVAIISSPVPLSTDDATDDTTDDKKVENLIKIVFEQGVKKAVEKVKSLNNPYILDEFHDRLIERLKELEKGEKKKKEDNGI